MIDANAGVMCPLFDVGKAEIRDAVQLVAWSCSANSQKISSGWPTRERGRVWRAFRRWAGEQ
jgi:hypothetical protein